MDPAEWIKLGPDNAVDLVAALPGRWYSNHPNADRASARILLKMRTVELIDDADRTLPMSRRIAYRLPGCPLTVRQLQVVGGCACGLGNPAIAALLGVSVETVKCHLRTAARRLGVTASARLRPALVARCIREGWL